MKLRHFATPPAAVVLLAALSCPRPPLQAPPPLTHKVCDQVTAAPLESPYPAVNEDLKRQIAYICNGMFDFNSGRYTLNLDGENCSFVVQHLQHSIRVQMACDGNQLPLDIFLTLTDLSGKLGRSNATPFFQYVFPDEERPYGVIARGTAIPGALDRIEQILATAHDRAVLMKATNVKRGAKN